MFKPNFLLLIIVLGAISIITCKKETAMTPDYDGKTISMILADSIILQDGTKITLQGDSISKIFYLVRHAEKDTSIKDNPPLTEAGLDRAAKLADILRGTRIDAIYTTMTLRAMFTADSIAVIKAMKMLPYDKHTLRDIIPDLRKDDEVNRILMVGHQNTVPAITNSLADKVIFSTIFDDDDYGNFIVVVILKSGVTAVYKLRY